jgi:hypothetical protein
VSGLATADGALSVALVPGDSDRVALAKPTASALVVQEPAPAAVAPPPVAPPATATGPSVPLTPVAAGAPAVPTTPAPVQAAPPAVAPPVSGAVVTPYRVPAPVSHPSRDTSTGVRLVLAAEALLTLASFGLLGVGPARGLVRLTGMAAVPADRPRGVGRFSRDRVGTAPSL